MIFKHPVLQALVVLIAIGGYAVDVGAVETFEFDRVRLLEGPFKHAQDLNLEILLRYDVDRLLAPFLKEAGLEPKGESFPNWIGLDAHIGGHYLSAMAIYAASTGSDEARRRMEYILDALAACQAAHGNGYVGGVPDGVRIWSEIKRGKIQATAFGLNGGWVPWYNLHKTLAGLYDAWRFGHSERARQMLIDLSDWCVDLIEDLSDAQMQQMLVAEHGGINEVLADVYRLTSDEKYLQAARRFSHRVLLEPLSRREDKLDNMHANTQVPKVVGFQRIAEFGGDRTYHDAARFFWETVVANRTVVFGGNSRREHFPSAQASMEMMTSREGPETCNTYNMLKLTKSLYRMDPQAAYADFYERALYNHILSSQHPEHGGYVYFTQLRPRHYRVYSAPNAAMWCCVGTGMENHGKYGAFIYGHQDDLLYVNLFIASELDWRQMGVRIRQETSFPDESSTALTIVTESPVRFRLKVRHPKWVQAGQLRFTLGDQTWTAPSEPSSYTEISRLWQNGDRLKIDLPMRTTIERLPDVPEYIAFLHGPIALAVKTGTEDLQGLIAGDGRMDHVAQGPLLPLDKAPMLVSDDESTIPEHVKPIDGKPLQFEAGDLIRPEAYRNLVLEPLFRIHDARYVLYWRFVSPEKAQQVLAAMAAEEGDALRLDQRTIDRVHPGEQQPEVEHKFKSEGSEAGVFRGTSWRHANWPGWFSYELRVDPERSLELGVRYWGNDSGNRTFDILIDGRVLTTETISGRWNRHEFVDVRYPIPSMMVSGRQHITVTFRPKEGQIAGGIFDLRVLFADSSDGTDSNPMVPEACGVETWNNPIVPQRADPHVFLHNGWYYLTATVPDYDCIELRRARTLGGLAAAAPKVVWRRPESGPMSGRIWAPEVHFIDGKWYLYFSGGLRGGRWFTQRMYALENDSPNPLEGAWIEKGQIKTDWEYFSLDATTFEHRRVRYYVWTQVDPDVQGSNIYIAKMDTPWSITGHQVELSKPEFPWEQVGHWVNEAPAVLVRNNRVFITYSASATDAYYCMGLLTADADTDLLNPKSWHKASEPVFKSDPAASQFGPGHNSFTTTVDGKTDIMVYHARNYETIKGSPLANPDRATRAQVVHWKPDGTPDFGSPVADGPYTLVKTGNDENIQLSQ
jgi:hypothetical protein